MKLIREWWLFPCDHVVCRSRVRHPLSAVVGMPLGPSFLERLASGLVGWLPPRFAEWSHLLDAFGRIGVLPLVGVTGARFGLVAGVADDAASRSPLSVVSEMATAAVSLGRGGARPRWTAWPRSSWSPPSRAVRWRGGRAG